MIQETGHEECTGTTSPAAISCTIVNNITATVTEPLAHIAILQMVTTEATELPANPYLQVTTTMINTYTANSMINRSLQPANLSNNPYPN